MAFDLSTPGAQLAFGVAQRAQEAQDMKARLEEEARARANARLAPFGNDLSQFDSTFRSLYDPAVAAQQARAKSMQEYVIGLPELLARAQAERSAGSGGGGGGGGSSSEFVASLPFDSQASLDSIIASNKPKPIAVEQDYGNGMTYGNVGGYGAVYPTPQKPGNFGLQNYKPAKPASAVKPKFQRTMNADRFG
jgi:hypothetical protein